MAQRKRRKGRALWERQRGEMRHILVVKEATAAWTEDPAYCNVHSFL